MTPLEEAHEAGYYAGWKHCAIVATTIILIAILLGNGNV